VVMILLVFLLQQSASLKYGIPQRQVRN